MRIATTMTTSNPTKLKPAIKALCRMYRHSIGFRSDVTNFVNKFVDSVEQHVSNPDKATAMRKEDGRQFFGESWHMSYNDGVFTLTVTTND